MNVSLEKVTNFLKPFLLKNIMFDPQISQNILSQCSDDEYDLIFFVPDLYWNNDFSTSIKLANAEP